MKGKNRNDNIQIIPRTSCGDDKTTTEDQRLTDALSLMNGNAILSLDRDPQRLSEIIKIFRNAR
jgi:hypothetical protein